MDSTNELDLEVIVPIAKKIEESSQVKVYNLSEKEKVVCMVRKGPLSTMGNTFRVLNNWIKEHNFVKSGLFVRYTIKGNGLLTI